MRIASLDLGTNALLLTIADWNGKALLPVHEETSLIRLGENLKKTGIIHPNAQKRCFSTLQNYLEIIRKHHTEKILAVGTDALRKARNGPDFIHEIKNKFGIVFLTIEGDMEARITFKATQKEFSDLGHNLLMFDIGGGSTELVMGNSEDIFFLSSLDIGTVTLTEQFFHHDPILPREVSTTRNFIQAKLRDISINHADFVGIGVAGTITTLKAVSLQMECYNHEKIHKSVLKNNEVEELVDLFLSMNNSERLKLKGLPPKRADIIPMGAIITQTIMNTFGLTEFYVCDRGLRWGVLYDWIDADSGKSILYQ